MNKKEYAQANKAWLEAKAKEDGVKPLPKGMYYKVISVGRNDDIASFQTRPPAAPRAWSLC